ncbi:MAG: 50S ribosomal protein L20 [Deltaproteobacteria bacterium]|jgi:large subunit ribosomal protein L20|nr:50S ribosomal protein L20 [Deltaproteobacteria bacterium]
MRVKGAMHTKKRHKKYLKMAKGYRGARSKLYRSAREAVERGLAFSYRDRKQRKRQMRSLWITRISAAARSLNLSYSQLIGIFKKANIGLDRKSLSNIAAIDLAAFTKVVNLAQTNV